MKRTATPPPKSSDYASFQEYAASLQTQNQTQTQEDAAPLRRVPRLYTGLFALVLILIILSMITYKASGGVRTNTCSTMENTAENTAQQTLDKLEDEIKALKHKKFDLEKMVTQYMEEINLLEYCFAFKKEIYHKQGFRHNGQYYEFLMQEDGEHNTEDETRTNKFFIDLSLDIDAPIESLKRQGFSITVLYHRETQRVSVHEIRRFVKGELINHFLLQLDELIAEREILNAEEEKRYIESTIGAIVI